MQATSREAGYFYWGRDVDEQKHNDAGCSARDTNGFVLIFEYADRKDGA